MARTFGVYGPAHPVLGKVSDQLCLPLWKAFSARKQFFTADSAYARQRAALMQQKLLRGETVYLLGIGIRTHNTGVALVEVSRASGVRLISNNEEERYVGQKHYDRFPEQAIEALKTQMAELSIKVDDLHACLANFDFVQLYSPRVIVEELPGALRQLRQVDFFHAIKDRLRRLRPGHVADAASTALPEEPSGEGYTAAAERLGRQLGLDRSFPIIGMRHHGNHAYFSYAVSPFANSDEPVVITVIDGNGEDNSISLYVARQGHLTLVRDNKSQFDSLGLVYSFISSTQGGWPILSSEGRYLGAAAWGNNDRLTNPYYRQLRQLMYFGNNGQVYLNRALANWHLDISKPYTADLTEILGPPIPDKQMWNPDAVLNVEDIQHAEITRERVDKAAAMHLFFEDVLFHIVEYLIRTTGSSKLILTGGTALNCLANMRLLEHFDEAYYDRYFDCKGQRLHLWVPPTPGDAGTPMGAAYHFALAFGAPLGETLRHAFYCGSAPTTAEIEALSAADDIARLPLGNIADSERRQIVADLMAFIVGQNGVIGLFQGVAETGPRALGHRSILANPCNPDTPRILNQLVKHREAVRPLAPMATYEAAQSWFALSPGASDDDYNAYNYMTLTAMARPESYNVIPAVIHKDGTARVQIVRQETDPLTHAYLKAMGRRVGVEVSVNTSLNVGSPIAQTPQQAIETLRRSKGLDGLFMVGDDGQTFLVWQTIVAPPKDGGQRLGRWLQAWQSEHTGVALVEQRG